MYWFIIATVIFIAEIFLGTFYLLVVSASFISAGLAQWLFDTSLVVNLAIAAIFSAVSILLIWHWQKRLMIRKTTVPDDLDLGQMVTLEQPVTEGIWLVRYRGTLWQAKIETVMQPGQFAYIVGKEGNLLILDIHQQSIHHSS